jgi:Holliday junction DNA helicase RuvA
MNEKGFLYTMNMIDSLRGRLILKSPTYIVVETGGVGYGLTVSLSTFSSLPKEGEEVLIFTQVIVQQQEGIRLFGFASCEERKLFSALLSIAKIGPRLAMKMLSEREPAALAKIIKEQDILSLSSIKGIGEKTAKRILLELSDKLFLPAKDESILEDAVCALISLGYKRKEAKEAVKKAFSKMEKKGLQELIKSALKLL